MATVHNPALPYVGPIQGGLSDGMQIHVSGTPEHHHNGFLISLQCGGSIDPRSECAFVFNPRFTDNQVVRNSLQGGSWGQEERHGGFPFHRGQHCEVIIHIMQNHYKVLVNGRHFCDFNHRVQKHRVTHITVEQGMRVDKIHFAGGHHHHRDHRGGIGSAIGNFVGHVLGEMNHHHPPPPHHPHHPQPPQHPQHPQHHPPPPQHHHPGAAGGYPGQPGPGAPIYNPVVPFVHNLGGLYPNKMIFISGIPNSNPSRFNINFQCGPSKNEIAFHFDARFKFGSDRNVIVRNAHQGGWGTQEKTTPNFPFSPDVYFDMIILVEKDMFKGN